MSFSSILIVLLLISSVAYVLGRKRSFQVTDNQPRTLHSLPSYYGYYTALWSMLPALVVLVLWVGFENHVVTTLVVDALPEHYRQVSEGNLGLIINDIQNLATGGMVSGEPDPEMIKAAEHYNQLQSISSMASAVVAFALAALGLGWAYRRITAEHRARNKVESIIKGLLLSSSTLAIFTTVGIVLSVLFEAMHFFSTVSVFDFLFGLEWSPQMAIRADQVGSSGAFGAIPLFVGTLLISFIAMMVAGPIGLMSAIFLSEYATSRTRAWVKPVMEILAGIPTVVYGFFAALTVAPLLRDGGASLGLDVSSESALAAGLVMGIMIIPFVSSLSDDVINAVPQAMRDGSYGLGATRSETIRNVIIPAALPGIVGGMLLAISRAIGETMIVVMAAGLAANLTANPLQAVTTVTVQIVTLLVGDQNLIVPRPWRPLPWV